MLPIFRAIATAGAAVGNGYDWKKADFGNYLRSTNNGNVAEMTAGIFYALRNESLKFDDLGIGSGLWEPTAGREYRIAGYVVANKDEGRIVAIDDILPTGTTKAQPPRTQHPLLTRDLSHRTIALCI
jgi:hypothetical protein